MIINKKPDFKSNHVPLSGPRIDRGQFLSSNLALTEGAETGVPQQEQSNPTSPEAKAFEDLKKRIEQETDFRVLEQKFVGPDTVLLIKDTSHTDPIVQLDIKLGVGYLRKVFPFKLLGIEGETQDFTPKEQDKLKEIITSITADDGRLIVRSAGEAIILTDGDGTGQMHKEFRQNPDFKTIGLEKNLDTIVNLTAIRSLIEDVGSLAERVIKEQSLVIEQNGKLPSYMYSVVRTQEFLKKQFPNVPLFDMDKFNLEATSEGSQRVIHNNQNDLTYFISYLTSVFTWGQPYLLTERNKDVSKKMIDALQEIPGTQKRGVVIFGAAHLESDKEATTLQDLIAKNNISYMVLGIKERKPAPKKEE